jgi:prophage maintenance system killer protein
MRPASLTTAAEGAPIRSWRADQRIAFVVMGVFLEPNEVAPAPTEAEVVTPMLVLAAGELAEDELVGWVGARSGSHETTTG